MNNIHMNNIVIIRSREDAPGNRRATTKRKILAAINRKHFHINTAEL
jgi:hypothetical protein